MHQSPNRHSFQRQLNLLERLNLLLIELDLLPNRDQPVDAGFAGRARRLFAEADLLLGNTAPARADSSRDPAKILVAALLNSTRLHRLIRQQLQALRRKMGQSYPRASAEA